MLDQSIMSMYQSLLSPSRNLSLVVKSIGSLPIFQEEPNLFALINTFLKSPFYIHRLAVCHFLRNCTKKMFYVLFNDNIQIVSRTAMENLPDNFLAPEELLECLDVLTGKNDYLQCGAADLLSKLDIWTDKINFFLHSKSWRVRLSIAKKTKHLKLFYNDIYNALRDDNVYIIRKHIIPFLKDDDILYFLRCECDNVRCEVVSEIRRRKENNSGFSYFNPSKLLHKNGPSKNECTISDSEKKAKTCDIVLLKTEIKELNIIDIQDTTINKNNNDNIETIQVDKDQCLNNEDLPEIEEETNNKYVQLISNTDLEEIKTNLAFFLLEDPSPKVKFRLLGLLQTRELVEHFQKSKNWRERKEALLYSLNYDVYFKFFMDPVAHIRHEAAMRFSRPLDDKVLFELNKIANSDNYHHRINIIHVLVKYKNKEVKKIFMKLADDVVINVKEKIIDVIEEAKEKYYECIVEKIMNENSGSVKERAAAVVSMLKNMAHT